ncbi:MAG TPA: hypothetical protein PKC39_08820 [Ferruginibacter sp.]|nr:hypothetical protein [Ferruginibacter sp.]HMP21047.1 hypothetical protein [Ferruginibacter sp.]
MRIIQSALLLTACTICFYSCIDTEEYIEVHDDNSGVYTIKMDMGKMLELASQFGGQGNASQKPMPNLDTVILFKDAVAASGKLTAAEKELYKDGSFKVTIDSARNVFRIAVSCPFKQISQLPEIKDNLFNMVEKLGINDVVEGKSKKGDKNSELSLLDKDVSETVNPTSKGYQFTAVPGKIANINKSTDTNLLASDSIMQMMQQMTMFTGDMTLTTVIKLPRSVKTITNKKAELSADRKLITLVNTLTDLIEKPEDGAYELEY